MTGSVAIDIVLGLAFIYLLYSLLATIIQEMITSVMGFRARILLKSIARMLDDGQPKTTIRILNFGVELWRNFVYYFFDPFRKRPFTQQFYEHPSIKYLAESSWNNKPAYLRSATFAQTLIDMLRSPDFDGSQNPAAGIESTLRNNSIQIPDETLRHIRLLYANSGGDVAKFKDLLEEWFNEVQERASSWFKAQTQLVLLLIGLGIAATFNVDSIAITHKLATDDKARALLVDMALERYKTVAAFDSACAKNDCSGTLEELEKARTEVQKSIDDANAILGLGRRDTCMEDCQRLKKEMLKVSCDTVISNDIRIEKILKLSKEIEGSRKLSAYQDNPWEMALGWVLTAMAISLGAPFWFDVLNKVASIRSAKRPATSLPPASAEPTTTNSGTSPSNRVG